ncbi:MAG TPA: LysR substrate-binding domain-containing protein [Sphingobium sp.]|nr:LysR substrate-binding domain-containing protein [Sphingobium sp.]
MELRHLRYFVAVAEELHFSRAAQRLNISQPPLSHQIAALEQDMGARLFVRDKRNVALTPAGEQFLLRARMILANTEEAVEEAKRIAGGYEGRLTIGYMSTIMLAWLGDYLQRFRKVSPLAEISLRQMNSNEQYMAVINGEIDVGFVDIAVGKMVNSVETRKLAAVTALREKLILCVSHGHPLATRERVSLKDLADYEFLRVSREPYPSYFDMVSQLCENAGFEPRIAQRVSSLAEALTLATAGYAIAIVPETSTRRGFTGNARFIDLEEEIFADLYLITRVADSSGLVSRFAEIARFDAAV